MSLMATSRLLTRVDLDALPEDGLRHELVDGAFVMTPAPGFTHQSMVIALATELRSACVGTGLVVLVTAFDVVLGPNVLEPDIIVAPREAFTERDLPTAPLLVVEVRSPSTGWLDDGRKRSIYEEYGVAHYWLADPARPSVTILELHCGAYVERAVVIGDQTIHLDVPFPVTVTPHTLLQA